ncbi:MAG: hypoxanthine phosphoribosyltransferase [Vulcanimicrobiaceae bacterium]
MTLEHSYTEAVESVIFDADQIAEAVERLAERIAADYRGQPLLLVAVLKGALYFAADLSRALARRVDGPSEVIVAYLTVSSYGNAHRSSGEVRLLKDTSTAVTGRQVLLVEDVVDNGLTLQYLRGRLLDRGPASLRTCVLLDKPYRRFADVPLEYVGMVAPDDFIVGYGLDYQERFRNLPYLARLCPGVFLERKG